MIIACQESPINVVDENIKENTFKPEFIGHKTFYMTFKEVVMNTCVLVKSQRSPHRTIMIFSNRLTVVIVSVMVVAVMGGQVDFTNTNRYQTWAADLKPGFIIQTTYLEDKRCYCKVPWASSSSLGSSPSESFSFNPDGEITSSSRSSSIFEYHFLTRPAARNIY
ncbi:hypothetical protein Pmani_005758 [Petrolisthes manimaculis]|uniref:Uncharacterized protein n=1 Tax=Petrolisthes manimaculis TaxID=1843537 RepID=A0AAE1QC33_9EUCA|nr:hypothetical protein Pmani_005758 [Petrolisthes manimaculis]